MENKKYTYFVATIGVIALALFLIVIVIGGFKNNEVIQPVETTDEIIDVVSEADAPSIKYDYEWFSNKKVAIDKCIDEEQMAKEEYDNFIELLPSDRANWSEYDRNEEKELRTKILELKSKTSEEIRLYNKAVEDVLKSTLQGLPTYIER